LFKSKRSISRLTHEVFKKTLLGIHVFSFIAASFKTLYVSLAKRRCAKENADVSNFRLAGNGPAYVQ
jgi:hypothetical protein